METPNELFIWKIVYEWSPAEDQGKFTDTAFIVGTTSKEAWDNLINWFKENGYNDPVKKIFLKKRTCTKIDLIGPDKNGYQIVPKPN